MSIKFPPSILGPEMAAPILWAPGIFGFFLLENPHAHKIPPFTGGVLGFFRRGGWKCQFFFMGVGIYPSKEGRNCDRFEPLRFQIASGLDLKLLVIWASKSVFDSAHAYGVVLSEGTVLGTFWKTPLLRWAESPIANR